MARKYNVLNIASFRCRDGLPDILAVWPVVNAALDYAVTGFTISIMVQHWADGTVYRKLNFNQDHRWSNKIVW